MLQATFLHIPNVGERTEHKLWKNGIKSWEAALTNGLDCVGDNRRERLRKYSKASIQAIEDDNPEFFANHLASKHHWRSYDELNNTTCFVDIETTGLDEHRHDITMIGVYDGNDSHIYIRGKNMDEFPQAIQNYDHIVTFNGARFDIPFIEANLAVNFTQLHTDLMFLLKRLGYTGGLKAIEPHFGIERDSTVDDVDGAEAVRLWHQYERGDDDALQRLITYNKEDIANLHVIMEQAFTEMKQEIATW